MADRVPPRNSEAEQAVLGSMLLDKEAADEVADVLTELDFYEERHRTIYACIVELRRQSKPVDLIVITDGLRDAGKLEKIGGASYISHLAMAVPTAANALHYAGIVKQKARLRRVIDVATQAARAAYDDDDEAVDILQQGAADIDADANQAEAVPMSQVLDEAVEIINQRQKTRQVVTGVPTGFHDLDDQTSGLQPGELAILGARPSMGKSALAGCIAEHAARRGHGVLHVLLEDMPVNLAQRRLASLSKISLRDIRRGFIPEQGWQDISAHWCDLSALPWWILGPSNVKAGTIRAAARKLKRAGRLGLIIVDYLQLLRPMRERENRYLEVTENCRALKMIAQEMQVPVLALAQLSRALEARADKRPMLCDLRESGDIEQDADLVMFIYRDEYYKPDSERKGIAEIIIAKQRNGPIGTVELQFAEAYATFRDLSRRDDLCDAGPCVSGWR